MIKAAAAVFSGFTFNREKHEMCEKKTTGKGRKGGEGNKKSTDYTD
ncbi:MAG: hypothetical protein LBQ88_08020 [Treponema sp.]|nr:hypothetical protein [Treponema sp.]